MLLPEMKNCRVMFVEGDSAAHAALATLTKVHLAYLGLIGVTNAALDLFAADTLRYVGDAAGPVRPASLALRKACAPGSKYGRLRPPSKLRLDCLAQTPRKCGFAAQC